jgi:hypothetical protein
MERTKVVVATNLGANQMWKEVKRSIMFEFFVITFQCGLFTMTNFSDVIFECVGNCFSKLWKQ